MRTLERSLCNLLRFAWLLAMVDRKGARPEEMPGRQYDYDAARRQPDRTVLPWYGAYS
jgi:hypothetical protein